MNYTNDEIKHMIMELDEGMPSEKFYNLSAIIETKYGVNASRILHRNIHFNYDTKIFRVAYYTYAEKVWNEILSARN